MQPQRNAAVVIPFDVPDDQVRSLSVDIENQIRSLPTAIEDVHTCRLAKESLPVLKRAEDRVKALWGDVKQAAHEAHAKICAKEKSQLTPIVQARSQLSSLIYAFEQAEARRRREEERRIAEEEKQRRDAAALAEAQQLSDHGAPEMADQVLEQAIATPAPVVTLPSTATKVAGVSSIANWQWRFDGCGTGLAWEQLDQAERTRILALLPREYLRPDDKAITKVVKALRGGTSIPGVQAFDAGTVMVRG